MKQTYTAQIQHSGEWWIGWVREIPGVNCQERTREELLETLKITLLEALELNAQEASRQMENEYEVVQIAV
ncbi:MAG: type II toxin-antitoxin system HicB family antitoxin [Candidatus Poribacteria bacterium]|nr:type II toxin-antitoxin system HicB family antitoxin [Candidatus Poribacteria bacterium]